jgi:hypothetical protein
MEQKKNVVETHNIGNYWQWRSGNIVNRPPQCRTTERLHSNAYTLPQSDTTHTRRPLTLTSTQRSGNSTRRATVPPLGAMYRRPLHATSAVSSSLLAIACIVARTCVGTVSPRCDATTLFNIDRWCVCGAVVKSKRGSNLHPSSGVEPAIGVVLPVVVDDVDDVVVAAAARSCSSD